MYKVHRIFLIFAFLVVIWLTFVQLVFVYLQSVRGEELERSIGLRLRMELESSDPSIIAKGVSDFESFGLTRCSRLGRGGENFLDLSTPQGCNPREWTLAGKDVNAELVLLNGDRWQLSFVAENQNSFFVALWSVRIAGAIAIIFFLFLIRSRDIRSQFQIEAEQSLRVGLANLAEQVVHDIRSPLSALQIASTKHPNSSASELSHSALQRINSILDSLSRNFSNGGERLAKDSFAPVVLSIAQTLQLMSQVVHEKIAVSSASIKISVLTESAAELVSQKMGLWVNATEFQRIISNLLNNSIEAISEGVGEIKLVSSLQGEHFFIQICDSGAGIPPEILSRLGKRGFSFFKRGLVTAGSGLGLHHCKTQVESWGGFVKIESTLGRGTNVTLGLRVFDGVVRS